MFKCKICGIVGPGQRQFKIPTAIRKVEYIAKAKILSQDGTETMKTVRTTKGTEIVKEETYCQTHIPKKFKPKIVEEITREYITSVRRIIPKKEKLKIEKE